MNPSEDKDREVWRRYWTFWYEQRQQESDAAKRLAEEYGAIFPSSSCAATVPAGLTPMALLNAAVCVEGIVDVPQEKRQKIAADLCRMAEEMKRAPVPESGRTESAPPTMSEDHRILLAAHESLKSVHAGANARIEELERELAEAIRKVEFWKNSSAEWKASREYWMAKATASSAIAELKPCCQQYETCLQPCTPRGQWQAKQEFALSSTTAPLATSDPEGHRQAIADAEHDRLEAEARRYAQNADFWREKYESALSSSAPITDPLLPGLLEAERILRMIGYDEEDFAMQRLLAHIAPRSATEAQEARMGGISGANQQNGSDNSPRSDKT